MSQHWRATAFHRGSRERNVPSLSQPPPEASPGHRTIGSAWYAADRSAFLETEQSAIVAWLAGAAVAQGLFVEQQQYEEWDASVGILKDEIRPARSIALEILHAALEQVDLATYSDVILEYDFRRRGLRLDCVLLAPGVIAVLEFKRSKLSAADADQVMNYCVNLLEFHEETQRQVRDHGAIIAPILVQTSLVQTSSAQAQRPNSSESFLAPPWDAVLGTPICCRGDQLGEALQRALALRRRSVPVSREAWLTSRFSPSASIVDAAISLFGQHDVSAIDAHADSIAKIDVMLDEIVTWIFDSRAKERNTLILVSGAPGAGKTLVGLRLAFHERLRQDAVFVTGNVPLVDVLTTALRRSYKRRAAESQWPISGYPRESARLLIQNAIFKIVKAHRFLGARGDRTASSDGNVVIFDEAQRTYEKGRQVAGRALPDHEADLILSALERSYSDGSVLVGLLGHNQAINRGERGMIAWLEAAERRGWRYAVADTTLDLGELVDPDHWRSHPSRIALRSGHLAASLRFYRNRSVELWADRVMADDPVAAHQLAEELASEAHTVWITRDLETARRWARRQRVGNERCGLIASGQARRLTAEGLFVEQRPSIAHWMLAPSGDIRSSNMLETVQNQFQIQGLELDYTVVCWDVDLRRSTTRWAAWKISGSVWQRDRALDVAKNTYRVLLTRARKGMILFVPRGDLAAEDPTRAPELYDQIAGFLIACGAVEWPERNEPQAGG